MKLLERMITEESEKKRGSSVSFVSQPPCLLC
jgi:hypothetical protein